ncbi:hypothetical protein Tco_1401593 [Tanacetum coccineum]
MHNNIMAVGSKDRPPMLGTGRYSQWRSRFLWYIDTKPNGEGLRKSILYGPYVPSTCTCSSVAATRIGDDVYSTVDDCKIANEIENKTILKQLKKANASLTQELEECKTNLDETSRALGEATSCRDSCLIALQNKQNELEKYIAFNDRTIDYDILQTKLNETLRLLAHKDIDIKEGLKTKAYEISVFNQKHDELVKRSLLTKSQFEGQLKEKSKVISDLKVKEEKDIDKMIEMDK